MIIFAIQKPLGLPEFTHTLAMMLGLGAGIDYSLLIVSRFREQLAAGDTAPEAAARANATSGVSVVAAGIIVMVAIAALLTVGIPLVGKMGIGTAIAVACVVVSSITVLPIFLGALQALDVPEGPRARRPLGGLHLGPAQLTARPAVPLVDRRHPAHHPGHPVHRHAPGPARRRQPVDRRHAAPAYDQLSRRSAPASTARCCWPSTPRTAARWTRRSSTRCGAQLKQAPGVAAVAPASLNEAGDAAILTVTPTTSPQDAATTDARGPAAQRDDPGGDEGRGACNVYVGGQTAGFEDFSDKISARLPVFIAIVIGLSILLLMAVFRSIWVPLASAVFNLLSIGAAYGVVVAVFQWGWGASLLGVDSDDVPIISFVPIDDVRDPVRAEHGLQRLPALPHPRGLLRGRRADARASCTACRGSRR